jgi:acetylornithine/succinyldiaminopimelate/putrescine aminotransferase
MVIERVKKITRAVNTKATEHALLEATASKIATNLVQLEDTTSKVVPANTSTQAPAIAITITMARRAPPAKTKFLDGKLTEEKNMKTFNLFKS